MLTSTERGVKPLLQWLDGENSVKGFSAVDKVVGRAAAFLYVLLEVKEVYAGVMSEGAAHYFIFVPDYGFLFTLYIFLQCKDHAGIPLKKAGTFLPAYPTFTVLQADKLLFHSSSTVRTYFITSSHWHTSISIKIYDLIIISSE